jgi:hypothetical protein
VSSEKAVMGVRPKEEKRAAERRMKLRRCIRNRLASALVKTTKTTKTSKRYHLLEKLILKTSRPQYCIN